jgi:ribosomal protein S18 acetylase RimI-like enzyme
MTYRFQICTQKEEMLPHWALISQLNPSVTASYLDEVLDDMIAHGYQMVLVWDGDFCAGLSGIWISTKIYSGKYLEMDNVVIDASYRSKGIGTLLTDFITKYAVESGCKTMMLDAYLENDKAHAFYERAGFVRRGYHFIKKM